MISALPTTLTEYDENIRKSALKHVTACQARHTTEPQGTVTESHSKAREKSPYRLAVTPAKAQHD